jgi:GntR family transcriptional regulator
VDARGEARKHVRIADDLRAMIRSGELRDGDRLPGENTIMERYGVARMTARQALADLQNEGIAVARKGAGVFVRTFRPVRRFGNRRLGRDVWGSGRSIWDVDETQGPAEVDRLTVREVPAPDDAARLLGVPPGTPVISRDRRYLVAGRPVQHAVAYIPAVIAAGTPIADEDTGPGGIYARLAELGHAPVKFTEEIRARMPTREEVEALALAPGTPVVSIARVAFAQDGHVVEVSQLTLSAAEYILHYEFDA